MVYYGNGRQFEYHLIVAPHADPAAARLGLEGVGATIAEDGDLDLALSDGRVLQLRAPVAYQEQHGQRRAVEARYHLSADTSGTDVSFHIGAYNPDLPLVIDPLVYSSFLGGGGLDDGSAIAVSASDEVFVTGRSQSSTITFPTTVGASDTNHNVDAFDAFVTRLNSTGTALVYSTFLGGSAGDSGEGIAVNAANEAFVTGSTGGGVNDFPTTATAFDTSHNGGNDGFVTRLNSTGTALVYSTFLGGSGIDYGQGIAVNAANEAFVVGSTADAVTDFPTTATAFDTSHNGGNDGFVTRLNGTGTALVYSTFLGSSLDDDVGGIAINTADEAFVTGGTWDAPTAFPTTAGAFDTRFFNGEARTDAFVTRLNSAGTALVYSTFLGALGMDSGFAIAVNAASEAYVTGITNKATIDFPTTSGAFDTYHNGGVCIFVTRLNSTGSALVYSTFLGDGPGAGYGIAVNGADEVFVTGYTLDAAFPTTVGAFDSALDSYDAFVTRLNAGGTALMYSTFLGGSATDTGHGIAVNAANEAFVTGSASHDFPTTVGAFDTARNGGGDAFVAKLATGVPGQAPEPPTHLRVLGVVGNTVTLGWSAPTAGPSPTGYQIEGGVTPGQMLGSLPLGRCSRVTITLPTGSYYLRAHTLAGGITSTASNEVLVACERRGGAVVTGEPAGVGRGQQPQLGVDQHVWRRGTLDHSSRRVGRGDRVNTARAHRHVQLPGRTGRHVYAERAGHECHGDERGLNSGDIDVPDGVQRPPAERDELRGIPRGRDAVPELGHWCQRTRAHDLPAQRHGGVCGQHPHHAEGSERGRVGGHLQLQCGGDQPLWHQSAHDGANGAPSVAHLPGRGSSVSTEPLFFASPPASTSIRCCIVGMLLREKWEACATFGREAYCTRRNAVA